MKRKTSLYATDMRHDIDKFEGGGGGTEEYSTTEKVIGKWIDGKKLYRKVIVSEEPLMSKRESVVGYIEGYDTIVNLSLVTRGSGSNNFFKDYQTSEQDATSISISVKESDYGVYVRPLGNWSNPKLVIIAEYTKEGD